jgi:hypothetical protein
MKQATMSKEAYWGDLSLICGSMLALFGLAMDRKSARWRQGMAVVAAVCLLVGAAFSAGAELSNYGKRHPDQASLTVVGVLLVVVYILICIALAKKDKANQAGRAEERQREPRGHVDVQVGAEVEKAETNEEAGHDLTVNPRETPVQPSQQTLPRVNQEA